MLSSQDHWYAGILTGVSQWLSYIGRTSWKKYLIREAKIVGGQDATPGKHPHQVCIRAVEIPKGRVTICGGSLITDCHVLTAAHCLFQVDYVILTFGSVYSAIFNSRAIRYATRSRFTIHPGFDTRTLKNDVAIIEINRPVPICNSINIIRLPRVGRMSPFFYEGKEGIVTGWGSTSDGSRNFSNVLQQAKVKVMKQYLCRTWYGYYGYNLQNSQLCTDFGAMHTGTGNGDSGGPLIMMESDGVPTLIGVISFGAVNCESDAPSVYTNVAMYLPWIQSHTGVSLRKR